MTAPISSRYRQDIDGLRAFSVAVVILHHLGVSGFGGGFVGVDVFFVISGWVITQNLTNSLETRRFSFPEFYERRIRRLLPGLAITSILSLAAGWFLMLPDHLISLAESVVAALAGGSNLLFWKQTGYFDDLASEKPMLHTWSLGVEEQFYLVYPLLFVALFRRAKNRLSLLLGLAAAGSLILCITGTYLRPSAAFYLMPTRFWELLSGGLLFLWTGERTVSRKWGVGLAGGGYLVLLACVAGYHKNIAFPGWSAMVPVLGTAAVILGWQGVPSRSWMRVATSEPVVHIGRLSYLLYLTHWPLIVFWTYYKILPLEWWDKLGVLITAYVLSVLIHLAFEKPFRNRRVLPKRWQAYSLGGATFAVAAAIALVVTTQHGFLGRSPGFAALREVMVVGEAPNSALIEGVLPTKDGKPIDYGYVEPGEVRTIGPKTGATVVVYGDSHAGHLLEGLAEVAEKNRVALRFYVNYCSPPALGLSSWNEGAVRYNAEVVRLLAQDTSVNAVIIAANWSMYLYGGVYLANEKHLLQYEGKDVSPSMGESVVKRQLEATVRALQMRSRTIYLLEPLPDYTLNVASVVARCGFWGRDPSRFLETSPDFYVQRHGAVRRLLQEVATATGARVVPSADAFRDDQNHYMVTLERQSLYSDHHHLSRLGSGYFARFLEARIPQLGRKEGND